MIYLDNAATWPIFKESLEAMNEFWPKYFNPGGLYKSSRENANYLMNFKNNFKQLWNLNHDQEIVFTSCSSESNTLAFANARNKIICTKFAHPSVKNFPGIIVVDETLEAIEEELKKEQALVSISIIQHETGIIANIEEIRKLTKKYYSKLHIDASQAKEITKEIADSDFITISSHKLGGPIGIAALITNEPLKPIIFGGNQENGMRSGTQPVPLIAGFYEAYNVLNKNNFFKEHLKQLNQTFKENIDSKYFLENHEKTKHLNFCDYITCLISENIPGSEIAAFMDLNKIAIGIGSACSTGALDGISVLKSLNINNGIRVSFSPFNTQEEIKIFAKKFNDFIKIRINAG